VAAAKKDKKKDKKMALVVGTQQTLSNLYFLSISLDEINGGWGGSKT
jgi:hypothetical protein